MVNFNRILGAGLTSLDARQKLVSRLKNKGIRNKIILEIIKNIPRHLFIETALRDRAYNDVALPIGYNQTLSQPYIVGKMTQLIFENDNAYLQVCRNIFKNLRLFESFNPVMVSNTLAWSIATTNALLLSLKSRRVLSVC